MLRAFQGFLVLNLYSLVKLYEQRKAVFKLFNTLHVDIADLIFHHKWFYEGKVGHTYIYLFLKNLPGSKFLAKILLLTPCDSSIFLGSVELILLYSNQLILSLLCIWCKGFFFSIAQQHIHVSLL